MKNLLPVLILVFFVSCSHKTIRKEKTIATWFITPQNAMSRIPSNEKNEKIINEFIEAFTEVAKTKRVPVGYEQVNTNFRNGETEIERKVYLKQNEYGYFEFDIDNDRLMADEFEIDYKMFISSVRNAYDSGVISEITKEGEGIYFFKGIENDGSLCQSKFNLKEGTHLSECLNSKGELISKEELTLNKVDLSVYESKLRNSKITVCSNILTKNGVTCVTSGVETDWWAFLFE